MTDDVLADPRPLLIILGRVDAVLLFLVLDALTEAVERLRTGRLHIQQHDVGMQQLVESVYLFGLFRHTDILYQWLQQQIQRKENVFVVVNDEYFAFFPFHLCFVLSFRWQR